MELNGKKEYYIVKGQGEPSVVFITGLGPTMDDFQHVQSKVSNFTKTLCYDRAGIGHSESFHNERTLENISTELNAILDKIGWNKPFILVGHSRGGLIARYFASKYPEKVAGLVLIDPALPEHKWQKRQLRSKEEQIEFDAFYNSFCTDSTKYSETIRNEFKNTFYTDSAMVYGKGLTTHIPITFIGSTKTTEDKYSKEEIKLKVNLINNYLKINPTIKLILTEKSGHFIYDSEPKLVINEIVSMLNTVKQNATH